MGMKDDLRPVIEELEDIASLIQAQRGRAANSQVDMQRYHREAQAFYMRLRRLSEQLRDLGRRTPPPAAKPKPRKPKAAKPKPKPPPAPAPVPATDDGASYEEWGA